MNPRFLHPAACAGALLLAACASTPPSASRMDPAVFTPMSSSVHRNGDDLLSAGLGLDGLRNMAAPAFADAAAPTVAELRRRALWSSWRGIADLRPEGGYGSLYGSVAAVPGREFHALATVPGARHPHRVMLQLPDAFDAGRPCVVVTASSGSRGIYGAIAVAGAWGLPRGCAVAYTDKAAGSDYFDLDARLGIGMDGRVAARDQLLAFDPGDDAPANGIAFKHAHSGDNPEADWGRHVRQAGEFALAALNEALPGAAPFTFDNTRFIAVGISNGGGAVLRAAEDGDWLDAVVAGEPSIHIDAPGARPLYDYTTEASMLMPCALAALEDLPQSPLSALATAMRAPRCAALREAGVLEGDDTAAQARSALAALNASGWTDEAIRAAALSVDFDLYRAVAVTYASAYGRYGVGAHPCGHTFAAQNPDFSPRAATAAERAAWWSDASGIPPGAGVGIMDPALAPPDLTGTGITCLRALWTGDGVDAQRVRTGVQQLASAPPRAGLPVVLVHGRDDGLIPIAFTSAPYAAAARAAGRDVRLWEVRNAQHFDGFLALPDYAARYVPLLPYVYAALDRVQAHLDGQAGLPADAVIETRPGGTLDAAALAIPGR
ncbi:D-(-)-3-hydroxybutyrate oligomer hydrolase [Luteimonas sp. MHLX1A]|uniref:D-(-)-3-hydroxybutyrate oligomer hydrolase n=1 Tax=Alterluteimonas muca TaxID=2878684 RepID=UPI0021073B71|nr:D-(-)-3-hydroxybutyrate oligomer hydrolase [Luteimonas sp. MHLX1A]MCD9046212.1 D-(-)-3-hydroxybutyrate oligomer hydrolase [Luteimonas sp. MHLX1A]